jgi:hypothetical protein
MLRTSIMVKKETRDLLAKIGSKDDTFDSIICNLIKERGIK